MLDGLERAWKGAGHTTILVEPLRHYLEIVRGVFLKGTGLAVLWPQHLALLALGAALLTLAARRFEKRVG